ncbi:hypothetical protein JCM8208_002572 [Rhodotorula glutinis]
MYRERTPSPIHQPVDHHGPLVTAEEENRAWGEYITVLQGKLVPDDAGEEQRRHDLLVASRERADAATRAQDDWMRNNSLTIVERERDVEHLVSVAKYGRGAASHRISLLQEQLRRNEDKIAGTRRRDKFVGFFTSNAAERRLEYHEKVKHRLLLVRQEIGNLMGEWQYQDDLVAGFENLLSTLRNVLLRDQEHVYDAAPPTYDAQPNRPPSRHRAEPAPPPAHRVPRRTRSQRPNTTYSLIPIDITDLHDDPGELGHEAIPHPHPPSGALGGPHAEHAAPHHHYSTRAAPYNPDLARRPTIRSSGSARHPRHSWVPSSPFSTASLLSPVERTVAFPWDDVENEPTEPEPAASRHHPGPRSTSPRAPQHHHAPPPRHHHPQQHTRLARRPAPGELRLVTTVGGGRPLEPHRESSESLHATNAAHGFERLPDYGAMNPDAFSPDTAHGWR